MASCEINKHNGGKCATADYNLSSHEPEELLNRMRSLLGDHGRSIYRTANSERRSDTPRKLNLRGQEALLGQIQLTRIIKGDRS